MALLTTATFTNLTTVSGNFAPTAMAILTSLSFPALTTISGTFSVTSMAALVTMSFPVLTAIASGGFSPTTFPALTTMTFSALTSIVGNFQPSTMALLTTMTFTSLATITGNFAPTTMAALVTMSFPALATVSGTFSISSMASLTTLSLPSLTTLSSTITCNTLTALANVTLNGGLLAVAGPTVDFSGCALTVTSVDHILTRFAALDGTAGTTAFSAGKTILLHGGTNSAPTFTGTSLTTTAIVVTGGNLATVTKVGHGLSNAQAFQMTGAIASGGSSTSLNGTFTATVIDANTFTYPVTAVNGAAGTQGTCKYTASTTEGFYRKLQLGVRGVTVTTN